MAEGSSSGGPVPTPKENASLLRPWFPDHPSAALHPTKTIRMIVEYRSMHILQFLWLTRRKGRKLWGLLPHQRMVSSLTHQRVRNGEFKTLVHEECKESGSVFGIIQATVSTALPYQTSHLNCLLKIAPHTTKNLTKRNLQVDPSKKRRPIKKLD